MDNRVAYLAFHDTMLAAKKKMYYAAVDDEERIMFARAAIRHLVMIDNLEMRIAMKIDCVAVGEIIEENDKA